MKLYFDSQLQDTFKSISPIFQTAEHLNLHISVGDKIDNLVYNNTIDPIPLLPTTKTNTESTDKSDDSRILFIGTGVGLSGVIIIAKLVLKKNRLQKL